MDEKEWLQKQCYNSIDETKLQHIFYFTIVWNIFEKKCCQQNAKIGTHPREIALRVFSNMDHRLINTICTYFHTRYITDGKINSIFNNFKFGESKREDTRYKTFVQTTLVEKSDEKNKLQALLYIAFRLRNNLYHGTKPCEKLYEQDINFKYINQLLMSIIDNWEKTNTE